MESPFFLSLTVSEEDVQSDGHFSPISIPPSPRIEEFQPSQDFDRARGVTGVTGPAKDNFSVAPSPVKTCKDPHSPDYFGTVHLNTNPHVFGTTVIIKNTHFYYRFSFIYPKFTYYVERFGFHYYKLARFPEVIGSTRQHSLDELPAIDTLFQDVSTIVTKDAIDYFYFLRPQYEEPMDETFLFYLLWTRPTHSHNVPSVLNLTGLNDWLNRLYVHQGLNRREVN